jgi:hypothetical protein
MERGANGYTVYETGQVWDVSPSGHLHIYDRNNRSAEYAVACYAPGEWLNVVKGKSTD